VDLSQNGLRNELMSQMLHFLSSDSLPLLFSINRVFAAAQESVKEQQRLIPIDSFKKMLFSLVAEHYINTII